MSLVDEDKANNKWIIRCDNCGNIFSSVVVHDEVLCPKCYLPHKDKTLTVNLANDVISLRKLHTKSRYGGRP